MINRIEKEGFIIKNFIQRELFKEEVMNIFYLHSAKTYVDDILEYMMSGECIVLLLCHETENPIEKWKKMIGNMDPIEAKVLRSTYIQEIRCEFTQSFIWNHDRQEWVPW